MPPNPFHKLALGSTRRLGLPIATYPGLHLTHAKVSDIVTNQRAQVEVQAALRDRYHTPFVLSAMDLSAEAEAFGCTLALSDNDVPTVTGRLVSNLEQARRLAIPKPGDGRTAVYLGAVEGLRRCPAGPWFWAAASGHSRSLPESSA